MKRIFFVLSLASFFMLLTGCQQTAFNAPKELAVTSLHTAYAPYFDIGAAVNRQQMTGNAAASLRIIDQHFNSLTPENDMKWESIQLVEGTFSFAGADALIAYAKQSNKHVIGHALVWHEQTPDWVFEDAQGNTASRELLLKRMKTQIDALAGRYKNDIKAWDVVNEALNEDGSMRESKWYQIIGADFVEKAFEYASLAAPNARLYYNDYNLFKAAKMDGAIELVKRLQAKNIRIDGIGAQGHYGLDVPLEELELSIQKVADAGLTFMISELDISVLKFPDSDNMGADISLNFALQEDFNPYADGISDESNAKLTKGYQGLFKLFLKYHENIDRITLWGVADGDSWRNNWPMKGRTDYPLLFDRNHQPKAIVDKLIILAEQAQQ